MKKANLWFAATSFTLSTILLAAPVTAQSSCTAVYKNAVSNIHASTVESTERSYYFNLYCKETGKTRDFTSSASASFPIGGIPISVEGDGNFSKADLEKFCKIGAEQNYSFGTTANFDRTTSVGALQSFNQCVEIEERTDLTITHADAPPNSFVVTGTFFGTSNAGTLDAVIYPEDLIECTSAHWVNDGDDPETLFGAVNKPIGDKTFNIACTRLPKKQADGSYFPYATTQIATSWGTYTVTLPANKHHGFELASQAEAANNEAISKLSKTQEDLSKANANFARFRDLYRGIKLYNVYQGSTGGLAGAENFNCIGLSSDPNHTFTNNHMKSICRSKNMTYLRHIYIHTQGGGVCGGTNWALICRPR